MLAAMSLNLWILTVIVRRNAQNFDILLMFRTGHVLGCWPVHHRTRGKPSTCGSSRIRIPSTSSLARVSALILRAVCTLTTENSTRGAKEPLLAPSVEDYELRSPSPYQQEHRFPSQQPHVRFSASPANSHPHPVSPFQMSPSFQYTPPMISEQAAPPETRPRSKSKPDEIFIHPTNSNIARAEVIATRMGFSTDNNEYVDTSSYTYPRSPSTNEDSPAPSNHRRWGAGNGRDVARGLLGGSSSNTNAGL